MRKQQGPYVVRTVLLESGERLPVLRDTTTGEPVYEPLLFALSELRASNQASNTLEQALRSVALLLRVLRAGRVDLAARMSEGRLLEPSELEQVASACSLRFDEVGGEGAPVVERGRKVTRLEAVRMRRRVAADEVMPATKAIRLHYIRAYLDWMASNTLLKLAPASPAFAGLQASRDLALGLLRQRMPSVGNRTGQDAREGIGTDALERLLQVVEPGHPDNPWKGRHNRVRNRLIVRWLAQTGVRRGELLNVRVDDVDFRSNEVLVARRADAVDDPRKNQPLVKTRDRLLPLSPDLARDTHDYILKFRRTAGDARRHPYLFVAASTGAPLSLSALNLLFEQLRSVPGVPPDLSPHVLRHTWNDRFSELADREGFGEEEERRMRARLMGWSDGSEMPAKYTRRHVRRRSRAASLLMQEHLVAGRKAEDA